MRLDKLLSNEGYGTRKEVKKLINKNKVTVDGVVVTDSSVNVDENNKIIIDGTLLKYEVYKYFMLNKPKGYVCANEDNLYKTVFELLKEDNRRNLFTIGRLDLDTEGLLLITNDGKLAHKLLSPKFHVEKKYYLEFDGNLDDNMILKLEEGIKIDDFVTKKAKYEKINSNSGYLSITEGKFHQVKRMVEYFNCSVTYLKRIKFANIELDNNLKSGEYRKLTEEEIEILKNS